MNLNLPKSPFLDALLAAANPLSARYYQCPVYLVGSAMYSSDPRDLDVVIPIPEDLFVAMYGEDDGTQWRLWARDISKQGRELTFACRRQVDFKTQPQLLFESIGEPRVKIDTLAAPVIPTECVMCDHRAVVHDGMIGCKVAGCGCVGFLQRDVTELPVVAKSARRRPRRPSAKR